MMHIPRTMSATAQPAKIFGVGTAKNE